MGYGLEETELLEYILKYKESGDSPKKIFILQGFFNAEMALYEKLEIYYKDSFSAQLIPFPKDHEEYKQQEKIIKKWSEKLSFSPMALFDEANAMMEELND